MKKFRPSLHYVFRLQDDCGKSFRKENSVIDLAIVNYTINRRNRRASDDLQDAQRDRQTGSASSSSARLAIFLLCIVFQERIIQVASTGRWTQYYHAYLTSATQPSVKQKSN